VPDIRTATLADSGAAGALRFTKSILSAYPWQPAISLLVRTDGDPRGALPSLFAAVTRLDKNLALLRPRTEAERLASGFDRQRFLAALLAAFRGARCSFGRYGALWADFLRNRARTREIGVRMALGQSRETC